MNRIRSEGTTVTQTLLGGSGNIDDNVLELPGDLYRAVTLRAFDAKTGQWSIWWLDSRSPKGPLDPPVRGSFRDGVGTFYADDTFNNTPIRAIHLVANHAHIMSLGASVLAGRRYVLGNQLGDGFRSRTLSVCRRTRADSDLQ
jgi:hypothetical protein